MHYLFFVNLYIINLNSINFISEEETLFKKNLKGKYKIELKIKLKNNEVFTFKLNTLF